MRCRPAVALPIDLFAMYCRQVLVSRCLGSKEIVVVLAESLTNACGAGRPTLIAETAAMHRKLATRFATLVLDIKVIVISELEIVDSKRYQQLLAARRKRCATFPANEYSVLQDVLFRRVFEIFGVRVKGGWTRWASLRELLESGTILRLLGDQGADEAGFDAMSRAAMGDEMAYFYGPPSRGFDTRRSYRVPYLDPSLDPPGCADHGRLILQAGQQVFQTLPDLLKPEGKDNNKKRSGLLPVLRLLRVWSSSVRSPGFLPPAVDCGARAFRDEVAVLDGGLAEIERKVRESIRPDQGRQDNCARSSSTYGALAAKRQPLLGRLGNAEWLSLAPRLQRCVDFL